MQILFTNILGTHVEFSAQFCLQVYNKKHYKH